MKNVLMFDVDDLLREEVDYIKRTVADLVTLFLFGSKRDEREGRCREQSFARSSRSGETLGLEESTIGSTS